MATQQAWERGIYIAELVVGASLSPSRAQVKHEEVQAGNEEVNARSAGGCNVGGSFRRSFGAAEGRQQASA